MADLVFVSLGDEESHAEQAREQGMGLQQGP